ncbi:MAG: transcriptional regulator [Nitrosomonas sp.]|nr:transcriptional regulator [Nitrosomonas sp.]
MQLQLIKNTEARSSLGVGNTTFYEQLNAGLITPAVKLGVHSVAWPKHEIQAIVAARIAGKSDDQIKELVKQLVADRAKLPSIINGFQSNQQPVEAA